MSLSGREEECWAADSDLLTSFGCGKRGGLAPMWISVKPETSQGLESFWAWTLSRVCIFESFIHYGPGDLVTGWMEWCFCVDARNCRSTHKYWRLQEYFPCCCDQIPEKSNLRLVILAHSTRGYSLPWQGRHGGWDVRWLFTLRLQSFSRESERAEASAQLKFLFPPGCQPMGWYQV